MHTIDKQKIAKTRSVYLFADSFYNNCKHRHLRVFMGVKGVHFLVHRCLSDDILFAFLTS